MICRRCCRRLLQHATGSRSVAWPQIDNPRHATRLAAYSNAAGHAASAQKPGGASAQHLRMWKDPKVAVSHLDDPLKLAEHTKYLLSRGENAKAMAVVRTASKDRACTVSWNHLINDAMGKGHVNNALDAYNELKKRGQKPDAFTYTILLRGLALNLHKTPTAVERALSIFHSMFAANAPVRPSTIHVNATIEVCAKARNLDAIYGITARLPESGRGSPDRRTYTMIFNCLADSATKARGQGESYKQAETPQLTKDLIVQGKRIWADVILRWHSGTLEMDEQIVCSMGRLLLLGDIKNADEVLSLVQQAAMLERELPPLGHPNRPTQHIRYPRTSKDGNGSKAVEEVIQQESMGVTDEHLASDRLFKAVPQTTVVRSYAVPGNEMLSLVLNSCLLMNAIKAAQAYWGKVSSRVVPDIENFHAYLRILRLSRAASLVPELLRQMAAPKNQDGFGLQLQGKTFLIAMSACKRNMNSPNCLQNATEILGIMSDKLEVPDISATNLATEVLAGRLSSWPIKDILRALDALEKSHSTLKSHYAYGTMRAPGSSRHNWREKMVECLKSYCDVLRRVIATFREQIDAEKAAALSKELEARTGSYERWTAANSKAAAGPIKRKSLPKDAPATEVE